MNNFVFKIFSKKVCGFFVCLFSLFIIHYSLFIDTASAADIGNYGAWTTEHNQQVLNNNIFSDLNTFQGDFQTAIVGDYVPPEARVGISLIGALNKVGQILQRSLFDFVQIFIVVLFGFWLAFMSYNLIQAKTDVKKFGLEFAKKVALIMVWLWVLNNNPGQIFMTIFGPIISAGAYASNLILDSIVGAAGTSLPDTCTAIRNATMDAHTADLLCMPTRLSGFFYTCVAAGFKWMAAGIGQSALTFVAGAVFVVIFAVNIWKFALLALGVIVDLFLAILLLPFTAITECFKDEKSITGIPGDLFKGFAGLFKSTSLKEQIMRFIKAIIYFIVLAIMAAIGAALLGGVVGTDLASATPTLESDGFMSVLIVGCLVAYLVNKASSIAESFAKQVDKNAKETDNNKIGGTFGEELGKDISSAWKASVKQIKDWRKALKKS
jgi:hypothetical protein